MNTQQSRLVPPGVSAQAPTYTNDKDKFWALYLEQAKDIDNQRRARWQGDTEGILVFVRYESDRRLQMGLFAASLATFVVATYPSLSPDNSAMTNVLLSQLLAVSNGSKPLNTSALQAAETFTPATSDVCVNALWFMSLCVSIFCALLAIMVQQWARQYTQDTQRNGSPSGRGPKHLLLSTGIDTFKMEDAIELMTSLVHVAVTLFFAGLVIFLYSMNTIVASLSAGIVALAAMLYMVLTFL
ncbi:hypothetical protein PENSPDRAFT_720795, partial [Peniophora sp. CONT]